MAETHQKCIVGRALSAKHQGSDTAKRSIWDNASQECHDARDSLGRQQFLPRLILIHGFEKALLLRFDSVNQAIVQDIV